MGVESSQSMKISKDFNVPEMRAKCATKWTQEAILDAGFVQSKVDDAPFLPIPALEKAASILLQFFQGSKSNPKILEIFAGNCRASQILQNKLKVKTWIASDVMEFKVQSKNITFVQSDAVTVVEKFGVESNVLLLISPPPGHHYADYFASVDFIHQTQLKNLSDRFIVFIGELGASDGTEGMYDFYMSHPNLCLVVNKPINNFIDVLGARCHKDVYIFQIVISPSDVISF